MHRVRGPDSLCRFWSLTVNGPMTRSDRVAILEEAKAQFQKSCDARGRRGRSWRGALRPQSWGSDNRRLSVRELSEGSMWRCGNPCESASVLKCDIRRGRPPELRARLAECLIDACTRRLGLKAEYLTVEFTQHPGDDFYRPGTGLLSDWCPAEAS